MINFMAALFFMVGCNVLLDIRRVMNRQDRWDAQDLLDELFLNRKVSVSYIDDLYDQELDHE